MGLWRAWGRAVGVQGSESADLYLKGLTPGSCSPTSTPGSAWLGQAVSSGSPRPQVSEHQNTANRSVINRQAQYLI